MADQAMNYEVYAERKKAYDGYEGDYDAGFADAMVVALANPKLMAALAAMHEQGDPGIHDDMATIMTQLTVSATGRFVLLSEGDKDHYMNIHMGPDADNLQKDLMFLPDEIVRVEAHEGNGSVTTHALDKEGNIVETKYSGDDGREVVVAPI